MSGWTHLVTEDADGKELLKPESSWLTDEDKLANYNSRTLNAIFNKVYANQFMLMSTCNSVKEAWEILVIEHEGTTAVRLSKL